MTRKSPKRSGRSLEGIPAQKRYSTASTNKRLSVFRDPNCVGATGEQVFDTFPLVIT